MLNKGVWGIRLAAGKMARTWTTEGFSIGAVGVMLLACLILPAYGGDEILANEWLADFQKAESFSKEHRLPILIHFHALWCGPCQTMESEVLNTAEVQAALGSGIIGVKVNSDERPDLVSRFGITTLPTDVIISADGRLLSKHVGSPGRNAYVARLAQFRVPSRVPAGSRDVAASKVVALEVAARLQDAAALENIAGTDASTAAEKASVTGMRKVVRRESATSIGLNGYSPVSLTETDEWKTGDAQFSHEFQGIFYQLSSAEELERFKASPEKFVPALHGYDPVSLVNDQVFQAGHLELGVTYESKVYFFFSKNTRDEFLSNPEKFSSGKNLSLVSADKKS